MAYMNFRHASLYHTAPSVWEKGMIQVDATLIRETEKAYCVDIGETNKQGKPIGIWVPKILSKFENGVIHLPEKIAKMKGLI